MPLTNAFRQAVAENKVLNIRIMMKDSLLVDPTFTEFREMEQCARNVPNLYDPHDGEVFSTDTSEWTESYMNRQMVLVVRNFSHERIAMLKKIVAHLYPEQHKSAPSQEKRSETRSGSGYFGGQTDYQKQKAEDQRNGSFREGRIVAGAAAGAVIGAAAAGLIVGGALATTAGAVIGGAAGAAAGILIAGGGRNG